MNIEISDEMAIELADAYSESIGGPGSMRLFNVVGALLVYIPDPRAPQPLDIPVTTLVLDPSSKPAKPARGKLTPHQREVYDRIFRASRRRYDRGVTAEHRYVWVDAENIGSRGACNKLIAKGWVEFKTEYGPRGGEHVSYRPLVKEEN